MPILNNYLTISPFRHQSRASFIFTLTRLPIRLMSPGKCITLLFLVLPVIIPSLFLISFILIAFIKKNVGARNKKFKRKVRTNYKKMEKRDKKIFS